VEDALPPPASLRVVVCDDSLLIREGIAGLFALDGSVEIVASCDHPVSARRAVEELGPDVALLDIRLPPTHTDEGIRLALELRALPAPPGVLVISQHLTPDYAIALLEHGSDGIGYLLKDRIDDAGALASAARDVAAGGCRIDPLVVDALFQREATRPASRLDELTPREREILADIAEGWSNQAIADRRVLSRRAVEKHAGSIFMKLGLANDQDFSRRVKATLVYLDEDPR
jgi:DNA-binding NarL/FixJ family response regulator